jgi:hypothetical protein
VTDELPLDREQALCLLRPAQPLEQALREVLAQVALQLSVRAPQRRKHAWEQIGRDRGDGAEAQGPDNGRVAERAASARSVAAASSSRARATTSSPTAVSRTWRVPRSTGCTPSSVSSSLIPAGSVDWGK